jgi:hypothetical protein
MAAPSNVQAQVKQLNIVYWALALPQVVFGGISYLLVSQEIVGAPDYTMALTFQKIALIFVPAAMAAGYFLFKFQVSKVDQKLSLDQKLKQYMSLMVVRAALFEVAFFFCCVSALATGVVLFLYMAPIVFLVFLLLRPTPVGIANDLQLSQSDANQITQL